MDRLYRLGIPFLIYYMAAFIFAMAVYGLSFSVVVGGTSINEGTKALAEMPLTLFGVCSVIFLLMWLKDHDQNGFEGTEMSIPMWFLLPVIGLLFSVGEIYAVRGLLNTELSEYLFGLSDYAIDGLTFFPVFFIALFILKPICFEFLFRGLFHQRLREESGALPTIVIVAGVTFLMTRSWDMTLLGLVCCIVYEYYRSLAASMIVSVSAYMGIFLSFKFNDALPGLDGEMNILVPVMMLICVVAIVFMLFVIYRKHESPYSMRR